MSYNQQKDFKLIWSLAEQVEEMKELVENMIEAREIGGTDDIFEDVHDIAEKIAKDIWENIGVDNTKPDDWD